jgi:protein MpaA
MTTLIMETEEAIVFGRATLRRTATALFAIAISTAGCKTNRSTEGTPVAYTRPSPVVGSSWTDADDLMFRPETIGWSVEGRAIECTTIGEGPETVLLIASIHGNETAGTLLLDEFVNVLPARRDLLLGRRIALLAVANPDGVAAGRRGNAHGVDLNRNFPAGNWRPSGTHGREPLSEPESRAIHELIDQLQPTRIVSIHQPSACIDYDGPAAGLAAAMAEHCDLPVRKLGGESGSLGSYAGLTLGIPIITLELPGGASRMDATALWERYGVALVAAIEFESIGSE